VLIYSTNPESQIPPPSEPHNKSTEANCREFVKHFIKIGRTVEAIKVAKPPALDDYKFAHFNSTILQKIFIPHYLRSNYTKEIIVNLDAGFILGEYASTTFETIFAMVTSLNSTVGAFCHTFDGSFFDYNDVISRLGILKEDCQSRLYPAGGLLAFNCDNYHSSNMAVRLGSNIARYRNDLKMADQETLLLTCHPSEIVNLHDVLQDLEIPLYFSTLFLHTDPILAAGQDYFIEPLVSGRFGLYKIIGSFKPWHRDFVDLLKMPYLRVAGNLYDEIAG
jgi:hypothetical protein